jgi:hypothetical protein
MYNWTFGPRQPPPTPLESPDQELKKFTFILLYFNHRNPIYPPLNHGNIASAIQNSLELWALLHYLYCFGLNENFWPKQYEPFCSTCKGALSCDGLNTFRRVWIDLDLNNRTSVYNYSLENSLFVIRKMNWRAFKELKKRTEFVPIKSKYNHIPQSLLLHSCYFLRHIRYFRKTVS